MWTECLNAQEQSATCSEDFYLRLHALTHTIKMYLVVDTYNVCYKNYHRVTSEQHLPLSIINGMPWRVAAYSWKPSCCGFMSLKVNILLASKIQVKIIAIIGMHMIGIE